MTAIDRKAKTVTTQRGTYHYDDLVLATGSYPFVPRIKAMTTSTALSIAP